MSQINLEEKISEKIKYDYRERLKKIQTNIKNNKSISRIDENYLKKVLDIESLPDEFIKKNEILRKNDLQNPSKSYLVNEIIDNQTKKSLKKNLYHDKLKSEVDILKEQNNVISNQKQKFYEKIDEFKKEKEDEVENLQSELKNIKTQMLVEKDNVKKQESEMFKKLLSEVVEHTSDNNSPIFAENMIEQKKAKKLLSSINELF